MNSRQIFYSLSFVDEFKKMGKRMPYMIHTMTDETYAINLTLESEGPEKEDTMFWVAFRSEFECRLRLPEFHREGRCDLSLSEWRQL